MSNEQTKNTEKTFDPATLFKLSYGLYVLTAREGDFDNGCIINTAIQVTDTPKQICIAVNKQNLTHDMILASGAFNLCVISEQADFDLFRHFGFSSGRDGNKFASFDGIKRCSNGVLAVTRQTNAYICAEVVNTVDCGTHTLFVALVTDAETLSDAPSATYDYYFKNIKPKPEQTKKKRYVCKICGYVHEGDELPEDFVCPWCKHGAEDFELM